MVGKLCELLLISISISTIVTVGCDSDGTLEIMPLLGTDLWIKPRSVGRSQDA